MAHCDEATWNYIKPTIMQVLDEKAFAECEAFEKSVARQLLDLGGMARIIDGVVTRFPLERVEAAYRAPGLVLDMASNEVVSSTITNKLIYYKGRMSLHPITMHVAINVCKQREANEFVEVVERLNSLRSGLF